MNLGRKKFRGGIIAALFALSVAVGQSCSSDDGEGGTLMTSCNRALAAQCRYVSMCLPVLFGSLFRDVDNCQARLNHLCEGYATWPGNSWTAAKFDRCADQMKNAACMGSEPLGAGDCANTPGSLASGAACADTSQCATGACFRQPAAGGVAACGTCRPGICGGSDCKAGESCFVSASGARCVPLQGEGTPCTSESLCATGLSCLAGVCAKSRGEGDACASSADCNAIEELTCIDATCRKPKIVEIGGLCTALDRCGQGGTCKRPVSPSSTCVAPILDGAPCDLAQGGMCTPPALCVSGICKLPAQWTCP